MSLRFSFRRFAYFHITPRIRSAALATQTKPKQGKPTKGKPKHNLFFLPPCRRQRTIRTTRVLEKDNKCLGHLTTGGLGARIRASEQPKLGAANCWRACEASTSELIVDLFHAYEHLTLIAQILWG